MQTGATVHNTFHAPGAVERCSLVSRIRLSDPGRLSISYSVIRGENEVQHAGDDSRCFLLARDSVERTTNGHSGRSNRAAFEWDGLPMEVPDV